jgi:alanine-glyoxylate transaminase/serine-glyoxylate transaminase/serine-pyruvate transaminase
MHPRVLQAMAEALQGHLDPEVLGAMRDISDMLRVVFGTKNEITLAVSGTGSASMEAAVFNVIERGDRMLVAVNGYFGDRLAEVADRAGAEVHKLNFEWGKPVQADAVRDELKKLGKVKVVGMVHAETSTGVLSPVADVAKVAHENGALLLIDTVTSLGGHEVAIDRWEVDVCYSGPQKCLGIPPGIAPITLGPRGEQVLKMRKSKVVSYYLDLGLLKEYWLPPHKYHHTVPATLVYAMREGLRMIMEEGLEARFARHAHNAAALRAGLEALGFKMFAAPGARLNSVTTAWVPSGVDEAKVRRTLLMEYNIEIGGGLGPVAGKIFRIGLMAHTSQPANVFACLAALEEVVRKQGYETAAGAGVAAAQKALLPG